MKKLMPLALTAILLTACNQEEAVVVVPKSQDPAYQKAEDKPAESVTLQEVQSDEKVVAVVAEPIAKPIDTSDKQKRLSAEKTKNTPRTVYATAQWFKMAMVTTALKGNQKAMTEDNAKCLIAGDYGDYLVLAQSMLTDNLSDKELAEMEAFYTGAIGDKVIKILQDTDRRASGQASENPAQLTEAEKTEFDKFNGSPLAQKVSDFVEKQAFKDSIAKLTTKEMKRCKL